MRPHNYKMNPYTTTALPFPTPSVYFRKYSDKVVHCILFALLFLYGMQSCNNSSGRTPVVPVTPLDTTITTKNAFTRLTLDSQIVALYIDSSHIADTAKQLMQNFYNSRNYQYAWFNEKGLTEHAGMLWNLYQDYAGYAENTLRMDSVFDKKMDQWLTDSTAVPTDPSAIRDAELKLTRLFFDYAFSKYMGNLKPQDLQWYIPRKKVNVTSLLDSLVSGATTYESNWEPLHPQYKLLRKKLTQYREWKQKGGWPALNMGKRKKLEPGETDSLVLFIKQRLAITGQYPSNDSSLVYNEQLKDSMISVQSRFGLTADGVIGATTINELNVTVDERIQQLLVNMERMRWLPQQPDGKWILVNIPSFSLRVYNKDTSLLYMKIVAGSATNKTVIFSDEMKNIVFSPYWNVTPTIVRTEVLPAMKKNPNYLQKNNMEQTGTSGGLPVIRQLPGTSNALGLVKFLFPNNYNIYLHDTPSKSGFTQTSRALSHGCIRLSEPFALAKLLLRDDPSWTDEKIKAAMNKKKETWVTLKQHVPVFITYFTAWVDEKGELQLRKDIYGHDKQMEQQLFAGNFKKTNQILAKLK